MRKLDSFLKGLRFWCKSKCYSVFKMLRWELRIIKEKCKRVMLTCSSWNIRWQTEWSCLRNCKLNMVFTKIIRSSFSLRESSKLGCRVGLYNIKRWLKLCCKGKDNSRIFCWILYGAVNGLAWWSIKRGWDEIRNNWCVIKSWDIKSWENEYEVVVLFERKIFLIEHNITTNYNLSSFQDQEFVTLNAIRTTNENALHSLWIKFSSMGSRLDA